LIKTTAAMATLPWLGTLSEGAPRDASAQIHRILSCNIRTPLAADKKSGDGWDSRKELCAEVIASQKADLIGFQEAYTIQLDYLKRHLPEYGSFGQAIPGYHPIPGPEYNPINTIFYSRKRYELISAGGIWLSETPHIAGSVSWDSARPRFANWVYLKDRASGRDFRFWNMHLDHKGKVARKEQVRVFNEAANAYTELMPQIVTADFNADATTPPVKFMKEHGWVDTYAEIHGSQDPGFTFHKFKGPNYSNRKKKGKIDWIFYKGGLETVAAKVIKDSRNGHYPSDHYFLSADLVFKAAESK
jgi:endonuclease/exonuclease/phosphatase family metal-dependent hydrolase